MLTVGPVHTSDSHSDSPTDHGAGYGATLSWPPGGGPGLGEPDVNIVRAIDVARFEEMFVALMQRV